MSKPSPTSYPGYFQKYIDQVPENDLTLAFKNQTPGIETFLQTITEEKSMYAYAEGKWTLKELLQHIIDTERILAYRALCFARGEKQNLPGFEENDYAANSFANARSWDAMRKEFLAVRHGTEILFDSFTKEALEAVGSANNNTNTVAGYGFIILGHYYHHKKIIEEKYS